MKKPAGHGRSGTRRRRPGTKALQEIRKHQRSVDLLVPRAPMYRLIREVLENEATARSAEAPRISARALALLHEAAEDHLRKTFQRAQTLALRAKHVTVMLDDFNAAVEIESEKHSKAI